MTKFSAKHVNPFVEAAMRVVTQITGIEVRRGHLSYKSRVEPSFGVSIIIGIYGYLTGQVVYSFDGALAERLVDKLLTGKSPRRRRSCSWTASGRSPT
jgi:CheY-specific phosphatase CheX